VRSLKAGLLHQTCAERVVAAWAENWIGARQQLAEAAAWIGMTTQEWSRASSLLDVKAKRVPPRRIRPLWRFRERCDAGGIGRPVDRRRGRWPGGAAQKSLPVGQHPVTGIGELRDHQLSGLGHMAYRRQAGCLGVVRL